MLDLDAWHDEHLIDDVSPDIHAENLFADRVQRASSLMASLMPPALPRPPVWTWALIATGPPKRAVIAAASSGVVATSPGSAGLHAGSESPPPDTRGHSLTPVTSP